MDLWLLGSSPYLILTKSHANKMRMPFNEWPPFSPVGCDQKPPFIGLVFFHLSFPGLLKRTPEFQFEYLVTCVWMPLLAENNTYAKPLRATASSTTDSCASDVPRVATDAVLVLHRLVSNLVS